MNRPITFRESNNQSFGYSGEFKKMIHERPGLIELFQSLTNKLVNVGDEVSEGDVAIRLFDIRGLTIPGKDLKKTPYFKVNIGDKSFFVKSCPGIKELKDTIKAKDNLANVIGVKVVDAHYGFSDKNGTGYFVSEWVDLPTLEAAHKRIPEAQFKQIEARVEAVKTILGPAYFDTRIGNAFYDEKNDQIVLFDLNESQSLLSLPNSEKER